MTEADIWIKVFENVNLTFCEEIVCNGTSINILSCYGYIEGINYDIKMWFDRNLGKIATVNARNRAMDTSISKIEFENKHKDIFRQVKLQQLC